MTPIPFKLPDEGFTERRGSVRMADGMIEVRIQTALMGEWNKKESTVRIEPSALEDATLEKGLFKDRICLTPKNAALFEELPGFLEGEVVFRVWRKHRPDSLRFIDDVQRAVIGF